jgi:hypothetical protein
MHGDHLLGGRERSGWHALPERAAEQPSIHGPGATLRPICATCGSEGHQQLSRRRLETSIMALVLAKCAIPRGASAIERRTDPMPHRERNQRHNP